jgi:rRNA maturation endonuclease Nob1
MYETSDMAMRSIRVEDVAQGSGVPLERKNFALLRPGEMDMAVCHQCSFPLKSNKQFCTKCGAKVEIATSKPHSRQQSATSGQCSTCGAAVSANKQFCTQCGHSLSLASQSQANQVANSGSPSNLSLQQEMTASVKCSRCGSAVLASKDFCTTCGNPMKAKPATEMAAEVKPENKSTQIKSPDNRNAAVRRLLLRIALPVAAGIIIIAGLFAIYTLFIRKSGNLDDKQLLETYYGPPPFFTVIFAKDETQPSPKLVRREVWLYPEKNVSFVFLGGKYQFSSDLQAIRKNTTKAANKLRIEQITESLTTDELSKLVGSKPVSEIRLSEAELPDAIRYEYDNGVSAVFSQGRLLMLRIMPASEGR